MFPEILSVTELVTLQVVNSDSLSQSGIDIVNGQQYVLTFDAEILSGVLEVYQGTQLIFSSSRNILSISDYVYISDVISIQRRSPIDVNDSIAVIDQIILIRV